MISIIAPVGQQDLGLRALCVHHQIIARIIRDLAGGDLCGYRQALAVGAEVDLGREATS